MNLRTHLMRGGRLAELAHLPPEERARLWQLAIEQAYRRHFRFSALRSAIVGVLWGLMAILPYLMRLPFVTVIPIGAAMAAVSLVVEIMWMRRHVIACLSEILVVRT
jgi:hypothetical protein